MEREYYKYARGSRMITNRSMELDIDDYIAANDEQNTTRMEKLNQSFVEITQSSQSQSTPLLKKMNTSLPKKTIIYKHSDFIVYLASKRMIVIEFENMTTPFEIHQCDVEPRGRFYTECENIFSNTFKSRFAFANYTRSCGDADIATALVCLQTEEYAALTDVQINELIYIYTKLGFLNKIGPLERLRDSRKSMCVVL